MDQYTMQSYFKALCNAYYIAYEQSKRLVKEVDKLDENDKSEELEEIEKLQGLHLNEEMQKKYLSADFSKEKLAEVHKELQEKQNDYVVRREKLNKEYQHYKRQMSQLEKLIIEIIRVIEENEYHIIITSKNEILPLLRFFYTHQIRHSKIINMDEEYLRLFPTGEKLCEDFFRAYSSEDYELMDKLYNEYF